MSPAKPSSNILRFFWLAGKLGCKFCGRFGTFFEKKIPNIVEDQFLSHLSSVFRMYSVGSKRQPSVEHWSRLWLTYMASRKHPAILDKKKGIYSDLQDQSSCSVCGVRMWWVVWHYLTKSWIPSEIFQYLKKNQKVTKSNEQTIGMRIFSSACNAWRFLNQPCRRFLWLARAPVCLVQHQIGHPF